MHRIIVVGGGAGGLELVTRLGDRFGSRRREPRAQVVLVDRFSTHLWKPLLHEVAAGSMDPMIEQLAYVAQARWHGFEFQQGELHGLDRVAHTITLAPLLDEDGSELLPRRTLGYDTLVLAIGNTTNFFGVEGAAQHAFALDTAADAERFRRRLIATCVRAQNRATAACAAPDEPAMDADDLRAPPRVRIGIIGAGATGVELSAELRSTAEVLAAYGLHKLDPRHDIRITLIEAGPRILPALPERISNSAAELLRKLDIDILVNEAVTRVSAHDILTTSGKTLPVDLTVWTAGIKAPAITSRLTGLEINRQGLWTVRQTLQSTSDDDIFALGDCANCSWPGHDSPVPPRAQAAHQQASFLLKSLALRLDGVDARPLPVFVYRDFGSLVSLGHFGAVGNLMGGVRGGNLFIGGLFARFMYMSLYRLHLAALYGWPRMILDTLAHWLRRSTTARVKLH